MRQHGSNRSQFRFISPKGRRSWGERFQQMASYFILLNLIWFLFFAISHKDSRHVTKLFHLKRLFTHSHLSLLLLPLYSERLRLASTRPPALPQLPHPLSPHPSLPDANRDTVCPALTANAIHSIFFFPKALPLSNFLFWFSSIPMLFWKLQMCHPGVNTIVSD